MSNRSETIGKLALALSKAQGAMDGATKGSHNSFFKSNYADLAAVWAACREPLSKNELAVVQITEQAERGITIVTTLIHSSGEWIESRLNVKPQKEDPQALGSAISYGRRYALAAMVGIYQTDDDAEAAMNIAAATPQVAAKITARQAHQLADMIADCGVSVDQFLDFFAISELEELPLDKFEKAQKMLNKKKEKANGRTAPEAEQSAVA
jgi:hypothetical protein